MQQNSSLEPNNRSSAVYVNQFITSIATDLCAERDESSPHNYTLSFKYPSQYCPFGILGCDAV
jgi:hypothetical protein